MNEKIKDVLIKIILTIPALFIGIFSAFIFLLKPTIELWSRSKNDLVPELIPEDKIENHSFH